MTTTNTTQIIQSYTPLLFPVIYARNKTSSAIMNIDHNPIRPYYSFIITQNSFISLNHTRNNDSGMIQVKFTSEKYSLHFNGIQIFKQPLKPTTIFISFLNKNGVLTFK